MKRLTKKQKEQAARAALQIRVEDVYAGAWGREITDDDFCTAEDLARLMPALKARFETKWDHVWAIHNIGYFNDPAKASEFLYAHGVRA